MDFKRPVDAGTLLFRQMPKSKKIGMREAVLIYPHQLFAKHPALAPGRTVFLIEDPLFFSQYTFHAQKLILHRASMKAYEVYLREQMHKVQYIEHADMEPDRLRERLTQEQIGVVHVVDVVDTWLRRNIVRAVQGSELSLEWHESPQFLTTDETVRTYWGSSKKHLQHAFYVWQRKRLGVLMDGDAPLGGAWSFDAENRKALPKDMSVPARYTIPPSAYVAKAMQYVKKNFPHAYGNLDTFSYAVTHDEARACLHTFLSERLATFGAYEDAITTKSSTVFHSVLSPYLNNGLLTPEEVLESVLHYARTHPIPIASLEGFVRQLIGWREFIRMVYVCDGTRMRNQNVLGATRKLTPAWWTGTTGIVPLDHVIHTVMETAYSHHIERLMVVGNLMTLLGIHPDEGYRWFMEWYIDAYDWVMVPNVYGMALFADGATMTTKPYISSSNYLLKMSDYSKGEWSLLWDALYWAFVEKHQDMLSRNIRAKFSVSLFKRFPEEKQKSLQATAQKVFGMLTI